MLINQFKDSFDLENDFVVANKIRTECLNQSTAAILQCLRPLRQKRNSLEFQLDFQTLVIHRFEKAAPLVFVNGKASADDGVAFIFVYQLRIFSFRVISRVPWAKISAVVGPEGLASYAFDADEQNH